MIDHSRPNWRTWERLASRRLIEYSIRHNREDRPALLYVPRHLRDRGQLPLVIMLHGGASNPETIARMSAMHRVAEREGFIVVYPAGTKGGGGLTWNPSIKDTGRKTDDARFIAKLILNLRRNYAIDPARIYAAGFSIGGSLVYELACTLSNDIAAGAIVSGTIITPTCAPSRPVSLIHIHGTRDRRVPLKGGRGPATAPNNQWPPVQEGIDRWRDINGCTAKPQIVRRGVEGVTGYCYFGKADIELWLVEGGYHTWPGGTRDDAEPDDSAAAASFSASEKIWQFFAAHPRMRRHSSHVSRIDAGTTEPIEPRA